MYYQAKQSEKVERAWGDLVLELIHAMVWLREEIVLAVENDSVAEYLLV